MKFNHVAEFKDDRKKHRTEPQGLKEERGQGPIRRSLHSIDSAAQNHSQQKSLGNNKYGKERPIQEAAGSFPWNSRKETKLSVITCKVGDSGG